MYNLEKNILFYSSRSINQIADDLGIHHNTCINCIKTGKPYLDYFIISNILIKGVEIKNLNILKIRNLILEKRKFYLSNSFKKKVSLPITLTNIKTNDILKFDSIINAANYLKSNDIIVNRKTISKYLDTGKHYKGYDFNKIKNS